MKRKTLLLTAFLSAAAFVLTAAYIACLATYPYPALIYWEEALYATPDFVFSQGLASCMAPYSFAGGFVASCCVWMIWSYQVTKEGNYRRGEEHGSARWGTIKEGKAFLDNKNPDNNLIFTKNLGLSLTQEKFNLETDRNNSVLVVGGSGSGKSRFYVLPNIMQCNASFFVTDPKGTMLPLTASMLAQENYRIVVFNTIDFSSSMHYNPLAYIRTQSDILMFVDCLIKNTTPKGESSGDPFWEKSERMLYMALIGYLVFHCPEKDRNIPGLMTLLNLAQAKEEDESFLSPLDLLFNEIETGVAYKKTSLAESFYDPNTRCFNNETDNGYSWVKVGEKTSPENDFALSNYKSFQSGAAKTLKSIIISCNARLAPFSFDEMRELLAYDDMKLDTLGDPEQKTAIFAIMKDTADTFSFLFSMMMWQSMNELCDKALISYGGRLPTPVHFIFDEFANLGHLPDIQKIVAVVRSRNISLSIILQSLSQLKKQYQEDAQTIIDCCDTTLFLGGKSNETNKEIAEMIGKETISTLNINESKGSGSSTTKNYGRSERDLIQAAEVGKLSRNKAIVLIAGAPPFMDTKYDPEAHQRYSQIAQSFDMKQILRREERV